MHKKFIQANAHAFKEKQVTKSVVPIIKGNIRDSRCVAGGIPFRNLDYLTNSTLVPRNLDYYYGARRKQLNHQIQNKLGGQIILLI
jgi:hypothetical protein